MYNEIIAKGLQINSKFKDIEAMAEQQGIYNNLIAQGLRHEYPLFAIMGQVTKSIRLLSMAMEYDYALQEYKQLIEAYFNAPLE